jgi:hypothetical protein
MHLVEIVNSDKKPEKDLGEILEEKKLFFIEIILFSPEYLGLATTISQIPVS